MNGSDIALVIVTVVLAGLTGWYAFEMRRSIDRMDREREEMHRPVLIFQLIPWGATAVKLRVQNVGNGAALVVMGTLRTVLNTGSTIGWSWSYPVLAPGKYEEFGIKVPSDDAYKSCYDVDEIKSVVTEIQAEFEYESVSMHQYSFKESINVQKVIDDWQSSGMLATEDHPDLLMPRIAKALEELIKAVKSLGEPAHPSMKKQTPEQMLEIVKQYQAAHEAKKKQA